MQLEESTGEPFIEPVWLSLKSQLCLGTCLILKPNNLVPVVHSVQNSVLFWESQGVCLEVTDFSTDCEHFFWLPSGTCMQWPIQDSSPLLGPTWTWEGLDMW